MFLLTYICFHVSIFWNPFLSTEGEMWHFKICDGLNVESYSCRDARNVCMLRVRVAEIECSLNERFKSCDISGYIIPL